ncbi:hypothetical protein ACEPPN_000527 [Leptodophora sp. 'Broadleaf-Isolate-01']
MNDHTDISTADGGHQVLVSVIENLISVDRNTAGARPRQSLGQLSDESLRNLAQDEGNAGTNETTGSQTEGNGSWDKPKGIDATQVSAYVTVVSLRGNQDDGEVTREPRAEEGGRSPWKGLQMTGANGPERNTAVACGRPLPTGRQTSSLVLLQTITPPSNPNASSPEPIATSDYIEYH